MPRYVAFLRAINVGGHIVRMEQLKEQFEALRLSDVETFIASGNVIFSTRAADLAALERRIETQLHGALGYDVATFVRPVLDLPAIATCAPFAADSSVDEAGDGATTAMSIAFLKSAPGADAVRRVGACESDVDELRVAGREVYWRCRTKVSDSRFSGALLERALGAPATIRNVTTVRRLAAKYA